MDSRQKLGSLGRLSSEAVMGKHCLEYNMFLRVRGPVKLKPAANALSKLWNFRQHLFREACLEATHKTCLLPVCKMANAQTYRINGVTAASICQRRRET